MALSKLSENEQNYFQFSYGKVNYYNKILLK